MNQQKVSEIKETFLKDWGGGSPQERTCSAILDYILAYPGHLKHITHGSLRRVVEHRKLSISDECFHLAIQYLIGPRTHVLIPKFELLENKEEMPIPLTISEINEAKASGYLVSPETGLRITDYQDKVLLYFEPSEIIRDLK